MLARNFAENQEDKSSQNFKTTGQVQKRCSNVSASLLQNEQLGFGLIPFRVKLFL